MFLLVCAAMVVLLILAFSAETEPIKTDMPRITQQMVEERKATKASEETQRHNEEAARHRAEVLNRMYRCQEDDQCVIVDKDPCGCLKGPSGVTAINGEWSLEFSKLMDKKFASTTACPSAASQERECSPSAKAVCKSGRCTIVY